MPSNPKQCMSLTAVLMNSGDMVLHHFDTFGTRLWPTKMPTRIAFSHSKFCDLVRGRKVGCNSLNARNAELLRGLPTNCENHALIGCCSKFASLVSIVMILPLKLVIRPCLLSPLQKRVSGSCQGALQENWPRRKRTKDGCCRVVVFKKI